MNKKSITDLGPLLKFEEGGNGIQSYSSNKKVTALPDSSNHNNQFWCSDYFASLNNY